MMLVVLALLAFRERRELGLLLSVGVSRRKAATRMVLGWLLVLVLAILLSFALAYVGFNGFSQTVSAQILTGNEFNISFSQGTIGEHFAALLHGTPPLLPLLLAAGVQLAVYAALLSALFGLLSRKNVRKLLSKGD